MTPSTMELPPEGTYIIFLDSTNNNMLSLIDYQRNVTLLGGGGGSNGIPNEWSSITYDVSNRIIKEVQVLDGGTLTKKYQYYASDVNSGSIDFMEVENTKTDDFVKVKYNYTAGKLTSTTNTIITSWTLTF